MSNVLSAVAMIESILEKFSDTDQEKIFEEIFNGRCKYCYTGPVGCQCWNDE